MCFYGVFFLSAFVAAVTEYLEPLPTQQNALEMINILELKKDLKK